VAGCDGKVIEALFPGALVMGDTPMSFAFAEWLVVHFMIQYKERIAHNLHLQALHHLLRLTTNRLKSQAFPTVSRKA